MFENRTRHSSASTHAEPAGRVSAPQGDILRIDSRSLLAGSRELVIDHAGRPIACG